MSANHGVGVLLAESGTELPNPIGLDREAEQRLIEAAKCDPQAVARLYREHCPAIGRHILRRVGNPTLAEDLVADVFLAMVRYLPHYRVSATPFRAWLYRLATNRVNRWARWQRKRACRQLHDVPSPAAPLDRAHEAARVRGALLALPTRFQEVLSLHYLDEMSIHAIAQVLGCAEGTVKSRLSRGRDLLRRVLTESEGAS
jgi:RNA polymerase sigma-70 factor (ECF subfamily)